jgi:ssDNA-binding Zn-finger/Zn-ribbon topoisomerase 1
MSALLKLQSTFNPKKVLDTIKQTCPTCGGAIDTFIIQREEGIPDYCWNIVQCKNCKDYSMVSYGPNVKEAKFGNYELIEQLPKEEFTREQAEIRLEQVRHFRK